MKFEDYLNKIKIFTDDILIPNEEQLENDGEVSTSIMEKIIENDLFGISIPKNYGGLGLSMKEQI